MKHRNGFHLLVLGAALAAGAAAQQFTVTNLTGNASTLGATHSDPNLVNGWGMARSSGGPWWISSNGLGKATLYDGTGAAKSLVVTVPNAAGNGAGSPTGQIFNGTQDFQIAAGKPALFLFCTGDGTISGWNSSINASTAIVMVKNAGAVYTGMTTAYTNGKQYLYVTNLASGKVEVYDASFQPVTMPADAFQYNRGYDPLGSFEWYNTHGGLMPVSGLVPYNIQNLGGTLIVAFAMPDPTSHYGVPGPGQGAVAAYTPSGTQIRTYAHGNSLNAPWGLTQAPSDFGAYSHALLVGNLGSGQILAYNIVTGQMLGTLNDANGNPLAIDGLWALGFGNGTNAGPYNTLYFTAGPMLGANGLFGSIALTAASQQFGNDL